MNTLAKKTPLRRGMTRRRAADLLFILASRESYRSFVIESDWTPRQWISWGRHRRWSATSSARGPHHGAQQESTDDGAGELVDPATDPDRLVTEVVAEFSSEFEAGLAAARLQACGIDGASQRPVPSREPGLGASVVFVARVRPRPAREVLATPVDPLLSFSGVSA